MKIDEYDILINEMSEQLAEAFFNKEHNLAKRAQTLDKDIGDILQTLGQRATKNVLERTRDEIVGEKKSEGLTIHRNPTIEYNVLFGKIELESPYLWLKGESSKPLVDEMNITHQGRSLAVNRALTDFGIEDSFKHAAERFEEHYNFRIGPSAVDRATKESAVRAEKYVDEILSAQSMDDVESEEGFTDKMLIELDGCEIRVAQWEKKEDTTETTPVYNNPKKRKIVNWRDIRIGFARELEEDSEKIFVGKMDTYNVVGGQLHDAAVMAGMTSSTKVIGVADGGNGLSEELRRQFPNMQFILDKTHLKDHFYDTADELGIPAKQRPAWVKPRVKEICEGKVEGVLRELKEIYSENENDRLRRLIGYVERFRDALNYDDFKEKGYPIGSGEIESAHKYIPQKRLKISGASWHPDSINPLLSLRILRADGWWDDFWNNRREELLAA